MRVGTDRNMDLVQIWIDVETEFDANLVQTQESPTKPLLLCNQQDFSPFEENHDDLIEEKIASPCSVLHRPGLLSDVEKQKEQNALNERQLEKLMQDNKMSQLENQ